MQLSGGRGIKAGQFYSNEQADSADINFIAQETYQNEIELLAMIANSGDIDDPSTTDMVVAGLLNSLVSGLNVTLSAGAAVSFSGTYFDPLLASPFAATAGKIFGVINPSDQVIAFAPNAGANTRYDIVEIQPVINSYNTQARQFADPVTHQINAANVSTRYEFGINIVVKAGNAAIAHTYPTTDAGYIKVLEVAVAPGGSTPAYVYDARQSGLWNGNTGATRTIKDKIWYQPQDSTAGSIVYTLPLASAYRGSEIIIQKTDTTGHSITINTSGSDFINGVTTSIILLNQYDFIRIRSLSSGVWAITTNGINTRYLTTFAANIPTGPYQYGASTPGAPSTYLGEVQVIQVSGGYDFFLAFDGTGRTYSGNRSHGTGAIQWFIMWDTYSDGNSGSPPAPKRPFTTIYTTQNPLVAVNDSDYVLINTIGITLPSAPQCGTRLSFFSADNNTKTITAPGGQRIGAYPSAPGNSFYLYVIGDRITLEFDGGTTWDVVDTNGPVLSSDQEGLVNMSSAGSWTAVGKGLSLTLDPGVYDIELDVTLYSTAAVALQSASMAIGISSPLSAPTGLLSTGSAVTTTAHSSIKHCILTTSQTINALYYISSAVGFFVYYNSPNFIGRITAKRIG
jgi:hypothetical protein